MATGAVLLIGASGIVAIGLLGTKAEEPGPREPKASATSTTSAAVKRADPDDMGIADLAAVRLREILPRASARAARWHREAQLVSIRASPVVKGKIDATSGGTLEIRFARPAGARLGPGARVSTEQLSILVDSRGSKVSPAKGVPGDSAAGLPICVLEQAWRTMVASGVPSDAKCTMRYAHSERHGKAVWTTTSDDDEKLTRTIDGRSCTIVVR